MVFNPKYKRLNQLLPNLTINTILPNNARKWRKVSERGDKLFDKNIYTFPLENVTIFAWVQSFRYFEDITSFIFTKYSMISHDILQKVKTYKDSIKKYVKEKSLSNHHRITTVCVHVRRGDFVTEEYIKTGTKVAPAEDLLFAMNYMQQKYKQVIFFVASNGMGWCHKHLKRENVFFSNFTSAEKDFALMQSCDHMIMTVGTYGWWAAWMTSQRGGDVMYYRYPFTCNDSCRHFDRATHFPGHWLSYDSHTVIESRNVVKR